MNISREKNEWERTNLEKESRFKRFAFNTMKKATEGIMMVTISLAVVTGTGITKSNNIYGDEKMAQIQIEKTKGKTDSELKAIQEVAVNNILEVWKEGGKVSEKDINTIKKAFPNGDVLVNSIKKNSIIKGMINSGNLKKKDLEDYTSPNIFKEEDVTKLDLTNPNEKAVEYILLVTIASYGYGEKDKLVNIKNSEVDFNNSDYSNSLEELLGSMYSELQKGGGKYRVTAYGKSSELQIQNSIQPDTKLSLGTDSLNSDSRAMYGDMAEVNPDGTYEMSIGNLGRATSELVKHYNETLGSTNGSDMIKEVQKNPSTKNVDKLTEKYNLSDEQQKTVEIYAKMIRELNKKLKSIKGGGTFSVSYVELIKNKTYIGFQVSAGGEGGMVGGRAQGGEIVEVGFIVGGKVGGTTMEGTIGISDAFTQQRISAGYTWTWGKTYGGFEAAYEFQRGFSTGLSIGYDSGEIKDKYGNIKSVRVRTGVYGRYENNFGGFDIYNVGVSGGLSLRISEDTTFFVNTQIGGKFYRWDRNFSKYVLDINVGVGMQHCIGEWCLSVTGFATGTIPLP